MAAGRPDSARRRPDPRVLPQWGSRARSSAERQPLASAAGSWGPPTGARFPASRGPSPRGTLVITEAGRGRSLTEAPGPQSVLGVVVVRGWGFWSQEAEAAGCSGSCSCPSRTAFVWRRRKFRRGAFWVFSRVTESLSFLVRCVLRRGWTDKGCCLTHAVSASAGVGYSGSCSM